MILKDYQKNKIMQFLSNKIPKVKCPVCSNTKLSLSEEVFTCVGFSNSLADRDIGELPVIAATCTHCAYVLFLSAIMIGIIKTDGTWATEDDEAEGSQQVSNDVPGNPDGNVPDGRALDTIV